MPHYVIEYKGGCIALPEGETVVGRGLRCRIRFNDPTVSRQHLLLRVGPEGLTAKDLSPTNPSRLNGEALSAEFSNLGHDDVIELGKTWFRILLIGDEDAASLEQTEPEAEERTSPGIELGVDDFPETKPGSSASAPGSLVDALTAKADSFFPPVVSGLPLPHFETQNCPRCRTKVPVTDEECPTCAYRWPKGRPESPTLRLNAAAVRSELDRRKETAADRRKHPRVPLNLPAIYDSESLTFDAVARNISLGGLFLATELLDDIGTECKVTVLPDGAAAIPIKGVVCRTVGVEPQATATPGMGIRFTALSTPAKIWLGSVLVGEGAPAPEIAD